ncbi:MAG: hypothetical protein WKG07_35410 [Hymenobacter sp.]
MDYQLRKFNRNVLDDELLTDIKRVAAHLGANSISSREYNDSESKYTAGTIAARFGTWNNALLKAGLELAQQRNVSTEELFDNLERVWIATGGQPMFRDIRKPKSKYSTHQYVTKFGSWCNGLEAFIKHININNIIQESGQESTKSAQVLERVFKHDTKRFPNAKLKIQVLIRDGNKCKLCDITVTGENKYPLLIGLL